MVGWVLHTDGGLQQGREEDNEDDEDRKRMAVVISSRIPKYGGILPITIPCTIELVVYIFAEHRLMMMMMMMMIGQEEKDSGRACQRENVDR